MRTAAIAICALGALLAAHGAAQTPAPAQANDKYIVNKDWAKLPPDMTWNASTSTIAADGKGNVAVMVRAMPFIRVFTREGKFVRSWGDPALFTEPHSIMFDRSGFIWTTDAMAHTVYKFDANGKLLLTLGKKGVAGDNSSHDLFNRPNAVAIGRNGDIYVSDGYNNSRVVQFTKEGIYVRIYGGMKGDGPGQLQLPHGVALDSRERVFVNDSDNKRISIFDKNAKFVESWPFASRGGLLITEDDTVYVSDVNAGSVSILKKGKIVESIGGLGRPHGLALDTDGAIYVSDSMNRVVMKVTRKR